MNARSIISSETSMQEPSTQNKISTLAGVCEQAMAFLSSSSARQRTQAAISEMRRWCNDGRASGHHLGDLLMDEKEDGLAIDQIEATHPREKAALAVICYAVGYASWKISRDAGEVPHNMVSEFSEDTYDTALTQAAKLGICAG
ncbi:MAG: hypothetical protein Q4G71_15950 [Pseudomonadota bacterium]|nr:hypothetical protein [Pseudomonadota bacterium]